MNETEGGQTEGQKENIFIYTMPTTPPDSARPFPYFAQRGAQRDTAHLVARRDMLGLIECRTRFGSGRITIGLASGLVRLSLGIWVIYFVLLVSYLRTYLLACRGMFDLCRGLSLRRNGHVNSCAQGSPCPINYRNLAGLGTSGHTRPGQDRLVRVRPGAGPVAWTWRMV